MKPDELPLHTAKVIGSSSVESLTGTAFFVQPGLLLTCHHVVTDKQGAVLPSIRLKWDQAADEAPASVVQFRGDEVKEARFPFPDLALLAVDLSAAPAFRGHPCVLLSEDVEAGEEAFVYGYSGLNYYGDPVRLVIEGKLPVTGIGQNSEAIKLSGGLVLSGISGAPLLSKRTGRVCGIVKRTRSEETDLGGYAISASVILRCFPQLAPSFAPPPAPDLDSMLATFYDPVLAQDEQDALVTALLKCPKLQDQSGRAQLVGQLPDALRFDIELDGNALKQAAAIVSGCLQHEEGLQALFNRLAFFDGKKIPYTALCKSVQSLYSSRQQSSTSGKG